MTKVIMSLSLAQTQEQNPHGILATKCFAALVSADVVLFISNSWVA